VGRFPGFVLGLATPETRGGDEVLEHRHRAEGLRHLVAAADAGAAALVRLQRGDVAALVGHAAGVAAHVAGDQVEQRRLARAVGAQDAQRLARGHRQRDVVGDLESAVGLADAVQPEQHVVHFPSQG